MGAHQLAYSPPRKLLFVRLHFAMARHALGVLTVGSKTHLPISTLFYLKRKNGRP